MAGSRLPTVLCVVLIERQEAYLEFLEVNDLQFDVIPAERSQRVCLEIEANQDAGAVQKIQGRDESV